MMGGFLIRLRALLAIMALCAGVRKGGIVADLLNVDVALQRILERISQLPDESVRTEDSLGRVLAQDVIAHVAIPPFPNSSMDGYALRAVDTASASAEQPVRLRVVSDVPAGHLSKHVVGPGEAARIMTGAPIPPGADAVVQVEWTDAGWTSGGDAELPDTVGVFRVVKPKANIRAAGEDLQEGQRVLSAGTVLRPQDIGVLVSLGETTVRVVRQPRVAIIATGDELVDLHEPLQPGQIRNSNSYVLAGLVRGLGGVPQQLPIARDTFADVRAVFEAALAGAPDLIVSSAGVSVGARDVVRAVVVELGELALWRVNLRPGKPLAFGQVGGVPYLGLPGNPVSTMVTFDVFVRPALLKLAGRPASVATAEAVVNEDMRFDGRRTYVRVLLRREGGVLRATPTGTQSSGVLLSMVLADGLMIVPEGMTHVAAGTRLPVRLLRSLTEIEGR